MGLKFEKPQAVQFGEIIAVPKLTTELKLRLQNALQVDKLKTGDGLDELTQILAKCFPGHTDEVATYIESYMTETDMAKLATFLIAGEDGLKRLSAEQETSES